MDNVIRHAWNHGPASLSPCNLAFVAFFLLFSLIMLQSPSLTLSSLSRLYSGFFGPSFRSRCDALPCFRSNER